MHSGLEDAKGGWGGGRLVVTGRKVQKKTCQRAVIFVDTFLRCGKATVILWQGSSVGQSMRFIPAVSGVQIPPLLPKAIKKSKVIPLDFFIAFCHCASVRNFPTFPCSLSWPAKLCPPDTLWQNRLLRPEFTLFFHKRGHSRLSFFISKVSCSYMGRLAGYSISIEVMGVSIF